MPLSPRTPFGAMFLSTLMSTGFYGIACMQTFFYYMHYPNDPLSTKIFIAGLWILDTAHGALAVSGSYKYIMAGLTDPLSILSGVPELVVLLTALVAIPTQGFFVHRIYIFIGRKIIAPVIWVPLAIYQLVTTIVYVEKVLYVKYGIHVTESVLGDGFFTHIAISTLSVAAAVDVITAGLLTFLLIRERAATGYSGTAHALRRLTTFAINTGSWTAVFALLTLILLHVYPSDPLYMVFELPLCSVYYNTLLANLNARAYIRGEMTIRNADSGTTDGSKNKQCTEVELVQTSERSEEEQIV